MKRTPRSLIIRKISRRLRRGVLKPLGRLFARKPAVVVRVPPLDEAFVSAIKLVAPQFCLFTADEKSRVEWELDQNNSCWSEDRALGPFLDAMPTPQRILEIGPGFGRSAVFFSKRRFPKATFDLFDATGHRTKYELLGNRYEDSFCGNLPLLESNLRFNGVSNYRIVDAQNTGGRISGLDRTYDLIYSFYAVGFHWSIDHWLDEILAVSHDSTLGAFLVPSHYTPSPRVAAMPHAIVQSALPMQPWDTVHFLVFTPKRQKWFPA